MRFRYALIAELASRMAEQTGQFGRTALMKSIFLLDQVYCLDTGYDFGLYTYGPFSAQVLHDLDMVEAVDGVEVQQHPSGWGYVIGPSQQTERVRSMVAEAPRDVSDKIDRLVSDFGAFDATELELLSTIVFVDRDAQRKGKAMSEAGLAGVVESIKTKFDDQYIGKRVAFLRNKGFLAAVA